MNDRLVIRQLVVETLIGVYEFERTAPQTLRLDATLHLSDHHRRAGASDQLVDTLDYSAVAQRLVDTAAEAQFFLLEALGETLCGVVLREFGCRQVDLAIYKDGCIPGAVGAEYHLSRAAE